MGKKKEKIEVSKKELERVFKDGVEFAITMMEKRLNYLKQYANKETKIKKK